MEKVGGRFLLELRGCINFTLQHCCCFCDVVIDKILGLHCSEVSSYDRYHQMSDFKAKTRQIRFRLGLCPRPRLESLQRSPRYPSWI